MESMKTQPGLFPTFKPKPFRFGKGKNPPNSKEPLQTNFGVGERSLRRLFSQLLQGLLTGGTIEKIHARWLDHVGYKWLKLTHAFTFKGNFHCASHMANEVVAVHASGDERL